MVSATTTRFQPGPAHPSWRGGTTTKDGYVRITAGPDRGKFQHRAVIERLQREVDPGSPPLGREWEVHHMDFRKNHNCPCNLLLLQGVIHRAITVSHMQMLNRLKWQRTFETIRELGLTAVAAARPYSKGIA